MSIGIQKYYGYKNWLGVGGTAALAERFGIIYGTYTLKRCERVIWVYWEDCSKYRD